MQDIINALLQALVKEALPHVVQAAAAQLGGGGAPVQNPQAQSGFGGQPQAQNGFGATGFGGAVQQPQTMQQPQQAANMFGAQPQQPAQAQQQVTPEMIQTLITPLVQNEQIKQALTGQMQAMGINNLPDARPEQLPELYARFKQVEEQARAAGLLNQQAAAPSII